MSEQPEKYYTLAEAIEAGVDYYEDEDGILQRVDERIDENGKDIS
jgi:hypothetical protein